MFSFFASKKLLPGIAGIDLQADGVCLTRVERTPGAAPRMTAIDFRAWEDKADAEGRAKVLARLAADHELKRSYCSTVLGSNDYSLLLTEAPDVPSDELRAAIRWRIKDLIDFHINDATLDVFDIPGEKVAGRARPMYAVAARSPVIQRSVDLMDGAGVNLEVIDIPEMAQRNVAAILPQDVRGVVFISFGPDAGLLTITKQSEIYLTRNLDVGEETLAHADDQAAYFDRIVLEVQRSLDYYDSHFRQAPIAEVVLAPMTREIPGMIEHLKANLNANVSALDLTEHLSCDQSLTRELQARCLMPIGAALRQETSSL